MFGKQACAKLCKDIGEGCVAISMNSGTCYTYDYFETERKSTSAKAYIKCNEGILRKNITHLGQFRGFYQPFSYPIITTLIKDTN